MVENDQGGLSLVFDDKGTGRRCGSCTLCCRLVPVVALEKPAGQRCQHQRHGKGCVIYANRPRECRVWSCRWLADRSTGHMQRPDRAHYVVDLTPDHVTMRDKGSGQSTRIEVLQVWVDPAFPDAHRDPPLRAYLLEQFRRFRSAALIRYGNRRGLTLFPPGFGGSTDWVEIYDTELSRPGRAEVREGDPSHRLPSIEGPM